MSARQHQGTVAQQLEAVDRLARETAERVEELEAKLICRGILRAPSSEAQPAPRPPEGYPPSPRMVRRHGMYLVKGGAR